MSESWHDLIPPAAGLSAHLGDTELADVDLAPSTEKHLADCAWCQQRRHSLSDDRRQELASLLDELDSVDVPAAAVQAASAWSLPSALVAALQADSSLWPAVAPTQLWRMSWRGQDALAVVLERDSWWARVAPLTTDTGLADEYTFLVDETETTLSQPAAIFMRATATVPLYTLSWFIGDVASAETDVRQALRRLEVAHLEQSPPPADVPTGSMLTPDDWDRLEALDALSEQMRWFEAATHGIVDDAGPLAGRVDASHEAAVEASTLLNQRGIGLREVADGTGLAASKILDFKSGRLQPSAHDRAALTKHFGLPVRGGHSEDERFATFEVLCEPANRHHWYGWRGRQGGASPEDCLVPFMEDFMDHPVAARSVSAQPTSGQDLSREDWLRVVRDRLAMHRHQG